MTQSTLRVLMLLENCAYPQDVRVRHEAETLAAAGYRVAVIAPRGADQSWHAVVNNVHVHRFPQPATSQGLLGYLIEFGYSTLVMALMVLWRWLRDGIDVIHLHNPPDTLFVAALLPRLAGKAVVFDHHDLAPKLYAAKTEQPSARIAALLQRFETLSCRVAHYVITANDSYRQHDIDHNRVTPDRSWVVRNGPDLDQFPAPANGGDSARPPCIGYIGYIARQDGFEYLLYALQHLREDFDLHDWTCLVIGPAAEPDRLDALVHELGLREHVTFTGRKSHRDALELLASVDIGVAPEPKNPFNDRSTMIKIMEYMALSKPVVAFDLTEHHITAGDAALYAQDNDPRNLAQHIKTLIEQPEERARLGTLGRQRIEHQLSWAHSAPHLLDCYRTIAHDRHA